MYYCILFSIDEKKVGKYPQSTNTLNINHSNDPKFLNNIYFEKIEFTPIVPIPILSTKSKITDLISNVSSGGNIHLIISEKLKNIIHSYKYNGLQFFKTSIVKNNIEYDNYFSINMYIDNMDCINLKNSRINVRVRKKEGGTELKSIDIDNLSDFYDTVNYHRDKSETVTISNISLKNNLNEDFFMLRYVEGGVKYLVSEKLKKEIEDAGCTGIEFQPSHLSLNEWLHSEREKIYGKS